MSFNRSRNWQKSNVKRNFDRHRNNQPEEELFEEEQPGSSNGNHKNQGHPKHLKGREIGMFYAKKQNLNPNRKDNPDRVIRKKLADDITLPLDKIFEIRKVLNKEINNKGPLTKNTLIYDENIKSKFKDEFIKLISRDFNTHLTEQLESQNDEEVSNNEENEKLFNELVDKKESENYQNFQAKREHLPSYKMKDEILKIINDNQVILISGETGCGKTTQVAQFILDEAILSKKGSKCNIVCTQPRRISAITIAERVAAERDEKLMNSVGYQIRLENRPPRSQGSILFCTSGVLVKRLEGNPSLGNISHLILDEVHERDIICDLTIAILKKVLKLRKDLKLILMSATLRSEIFSKYFDNCPIIHIQGFTYPVQVNFLEDVLQEINFFNFREERHIPIWKQKRQNAKTGFKPDMFRSFIEPYARSITGQYSDKVIRAITNPDSEKISIDLIEELIFNISITKPPGAILVFLPGYGLISKLNSKIRESRRYSNYNFIVYPLHSMLPTSVQKSVFERPPDNVRKIIIASNIAETSITIDDVVYVIDAGKIKYTTYDQKKNTQSLDEEWVATANAMQRRGRAGRVQPGICYHLYTKARFYTLDQYILPEIMRSRLEDVILSMKILGLNDTRNEFTQFLGVPDVDLVELSINLLKRLSALDSNECLTPLGLHLARLPMDPQSGKMILLSSIFSCVDPITSVAASLTFKNAFYAPLGKEKIVDRIKYDFSSDTKSDHLMMSNVIEQWRNAKGRGYENNFCRDNFLSISILNQLENMKKQFSEYLAGTKLVESNDPRDSDSNQNSNNMKLTKAIISAGLYPNIAVIRNVRIVKNQVEPRISLYTEDGSAKLHMSSINCYQRSFESKLLCYYQKQKTTAVFLHDTTMINPWAVLLFGDMHKFGIQDGEPYISVAGFIHFKCDDSTAMLIMDLRAGLDLLLEKKICQPSPIDWNSDEGLLLTAIIHLLTIDGKSEFESDDDFEEESFQRDCKINKERFHE